MSDWKKIEDSEKNKPDRKLTETMGVILRSYAAWMEAWGRFQRLYALLKAGGYEYVGTQLDKDHLKLASDMDTWTSKLLTTCAALDEELKPKIEIADPPPIFIKKRG